jgi:hypothetical protein
MKREKQLSVIVIILLFLSIFSITPIGINFDNSQNVSEQVLEENYPEAEKDDKFFKEFFCQLFLGEQTTKTLVTTTISYSYLEIDTPFRPPIFS